MRRSRRHRTQASSAQQHRPELDIRLIEHPLVDHEQAERPVHPTARQSEYDYRQDTTIGRKIASYLSMTRCTYVSRVIWFVVGETDMQQRHEAGRQQQESITCDIARSATLNNGSVNSRYSVAKRVNGHSSNSNREPNRKSLEDSTGTMRLTASSLSEPLISATDKNVSISICRCFWKRR